jgi:hypothetical protein
MSLPILESPKYEVKVPSTGKKVTYRPYLVKEEKILMIAMESENQTQILSVMKDVVNACTFGKLEVEKLAMFDLEYIFLKLRSKSVGEVAKIGVRCQLPSCNEVTKTEINLDTVEIAVPDISNRIQLTDKVGVVLHWPYVGAINMDEIEKKNKIDSAMDLMVSCIECIYDDKNVYPAAESTKEELVAFLGSLNQAQFGRIQDYLGKMPRLDHTVKFKCKCGHENEVKIQGLSSFFE